MSDHQDSLNSGDRYSSSKLYVALFSPNQNLTSLIVNLLDQECYHLKVIEESEQLLKFVEENLEQIDCFVFVKNHTQDALLEQLRGTGVFLPITIIDGGFVAERDYSSELNLDPQNAEVTLRLENIEQIDFCIKRAIKKFLNLAPSCSLVDRGQQQQQQISLKSKSNNQDFLVVQQRRLTQKLKERLGYLGVYYKRDPQDFYSNATELEQKQIIQELKEEYQQIILSYFDEDPQINQLIDKFVNQAFFIDISVPQILEIHMELMDKFSQQLQLEGRSEEILLDYRLALIDLIAHLCEMYRRSIPRKDISLDLLFEVD
ncbi:KaiA domain protein [Xenococcus sp. PCC 7305]|uniref:circadian clock protein KaiA n=1 Tax=Xenococcus sp. PCC 7305 TaxID=102125 RepID=UPI0002AD0AEB|nr:circadian clock protein KaiA [Xenococcus sp. PCC 7305]ELS02628.1 KaiA domain protein [Xenococcus sp. PCC 7305]